MKNLFYLSFLLLVFGCSTTVPLTWSTPQEAFPKNMTYDPNARDVASRETIMEFPFDDVFASAEKALSFAQININESDQNSGMIYGTRSVLVKSGTKKYYYMVKIIERGPERCEVSVYSKQQQSGRKFKWLTVVVLPTLGLAGFAMALSPDSPGGAALAGGLYAIAIAPLVGITNNTANKNSTLKWSLYDEEYLDRIMAFIRTDLYQM